MEDNLINSYIDFKTKKIMGCCNLLQKNADDYFKRYVNTYISAYYYHILGTLDENNVSDYDYKVISKELEGTGLELLSELDKRDSEYSKKEKIIKKSYEVVLTSIVLDRVNFLQVNNLDEIEAGLKTLINKKMIIDMGKETIEDLARIIKKHVLAENKFLKSLDNGIISLKYSKYRNFDNFYYVNINHDIKQLSHNYKKNVIDKVFDSEEVSQIKSKTTLNLLNIDILKKLINQETLDSYFIRLSGLFFENKHELLELLALADNICEKKHVVFIIDYEDYNSHRQLLNNLEINFLFAVLVDMSHINDVEKKLIALEDLDLFKYVILKKIKDKDYEYVVNYKFLNEKKLIINDFESV